MAAVKKSATMQKLGARAVLSSPLLSLALACAKPPQHPLTSASPVPALADATAPAAKPKDDNDPCAVVATVLAEPRPEFGGLSAIERPEAARAQQPDGKWLVVLSGLEPAGTASDIECGERLVLKKAQTPGPASIEPFALTLSPDGGRAYHFTLVLGQRGSAPSSSEGRVERDDDSEWRIVGASSRAPRPLDAAPVERALATSLPAGQAQAWFEFDTGKDTLSARALEAGLVLMVRWGTHELRQVFASCADGAKGNALGDLEGDVLDLAGCGELYRSRRRGADSAADRSGQRLIVEKELPGGRWQAVISLPLPSEVRKISNPSLAVAGPAEVDPGRTL